MRSDSVCTWKNSQICENCALKDNLKCKFNIKHLLSFLATFLIFAVPSIIGVIISGYGWFLLGWFGFWLFFFNFWETRILCRHCPFYAEEGNILHCNANYGCYKLWKYSPKPMNKVEKVQLVIGFTILSGYPLIFIILAKQYLFLIISLAGLMIFFGILLIKTCSKCINFSCPLNRVPKQVIDAYLKQNPLMKNAWEAADYIIK
ncbi:MAG: hypothetical protein ACFFHV_07600 [Promethearchaeota archaeon]